MPVHFKGISEYDRNFKEKKRDASGQEPTKWAGLRSDELGITKEPSFASKRRVPYYHPEIFKSFQWKAYEPESNGFANSREPIELCLDVEKVSLDEEIIHTPEAPRLKRKARSHSADPRIQTSNGNLLLKTLSTNVPKEQKEVSVPSKASPQKENRAYHRALQKKAGLNIDTLHHPLRMSEYRKQFERKSPLKNSPLLAAEQVIYNNNQSVPPIKVDTANKETEYKSQFKGSPNAKGPKLRRDWEEKNLSVIESENLPPKTKEKKKKIPEAETSPSKTEISEPQNKQTVNRNILKEKFIQQLNNPYKGFRKMKSEYSANFLSPSSYKYKDGAWVRLNHVHDQVRELRDKAEYYRRRAQGTHFSRDHLNQILSANNRLWDVSSTSSTEDHISTNIKALDLAGLQTPKEKTHKSKESSPAELKEPSNTELLGISNAPTMPVRRKLIWDENDVTEQIEERVSPNKYVESVDDEEEEIEEPDEESKKEQITKRLDDVILNPLADGSERTSLSSGEGGRLPTPKLRTYGLAHRTHHDLTTPATGGALLVSPSKNSPHANEEKHMGSLEKNSPSNNPVSKENLKRKHSKDEKQSAQSPPVAGMKTVDLLPLRDDLWPNRQNYSKPTAVASDPATRSPVQKSFLSTSPQRSPTCRIHGALRHPEFQHNGNFGSQNYLKTSFLDDNIEDDRLSQISARSAASSSLASQVLERAQKRKEHFWGKK
ncbi:nuclear protein MDM1 isoform X2 [Bombina bombina]|uniref:nuclear protein MDM1 isoform X2 n=1 Tax=Bombina bombina TaxID=8345 RepID=UPI00235A8F30|nr:nuclear protein MDM1 isoform X2 [Bombina bombina]